MLLKRIVPSVFANGLPFENVQPSGLDRLAQGPQPLGTRKTIVIDESQPLAPRLAGAAVSIRRWPAPGTVNPAYPRIARGPHGLGSLPGTVIANDHLVVSGDLAARGNQPALDSRREAIQAPRKQIVAVASGNDDGDEHLNPFSYARKPVNASTETE